MPSALKRWGCKGWNRAYAQPPACPSGRVPMRQNLRTTASLTRGTCRWHERKQRTETDSSFVPQRKGTGELENGKRWG